MKLFSASQRRKEMADFLFHLRRAGNGLRDFVPEDFAVALAQPVNGHLDCALRHVQPRGQIGVGRSHLLDREAAFQLLVEFRLAGLGVFGVKAQRRS